PPAPHGRLGLVPTFVSVEAEKRGGPGAHMRGPPGLLCLRVAAPSFPRTAGTSRTRPPGGHRDRGRERNPRCSPGVMYVPFVSAVLHVRNDAVALWTDTHQAPDPLGAWSGRPSFWVQATTDMVAGLTEKDWSVDGSGAP